MERSIAGVLFLVAAVAFSVSAGAWWMQRIVFTPGMRGQSFSSFSRLELDTVITGAAAGTLETSATELSATLESVILSTRAGALVMVPVMHQAHERIIGLRDDEPVQVTGDDLIPIVRDQRAAEVPDITMPIQPIGILKTTRSVLGWMIPIGAAIGGLAILIALIARPERRDIVRGLGEFGLALAVSMLLFGYLIPVQFLTAIDNRTWTHAIAQLALRTLPVVIGAAAIFALGGAVLILSSRSGGKRRQWSTPLAVSRYQGRDDTAWS